LGYSDSHNGLLSPYFKKSSKKTFFGLSVSLLFRTLFLPFFTNTFIDCFICQLAFTHNLSYISILEQNYKQIPPIVPFFKIGRADALIPRGDFLEFLAYN